MAAIREHDSVVLCRDMPAHGLRAGDVGAVVGCYTDGMGLEVEFITAEGRTVAVVTLEAADIRRMGAGEILHVRDLAVA